MKNKSFSLPKDIIRDIIQWDVESWSTILGFFDEKIDWNTVENCLELGGRQGGLSLWLALKGKKVVCSDLSNAWELAEPLHQKYGVTRLITYRDIDATNIPYEDTFDIIVFKSIIGGIGSNNNIEKSQKVFEQIYKALKPGGRLLFAENLIGSPFHKAARKIFVRWGKSWRYVSLNEMGEEGFLRLYKKKEVKTTGVLAAFGRSEWQRNALACIDKLFFNRICLDRWKYISFGIAEK